MIKVILFCCVATAMGASSLEFKDTDGVCSMQKSGNTISVVDCDLSLHNSNYASVAAGLNDITGHKSEYHPTEESINGIISEINGLKSFIEYVKVPCTTSGMTANRGVSFSPLANKVTGDDATLSCGDGFKTASTTMGCFADGFRGAQPTCNPYVCPAETLNFDGGASVAFSATENRHLNPSGWSVTKTCPNSHTGSITRECHYNSEAWSTSGTCIEKACPAVNFYGQNFASLTHGNSHSVSCPSGYTGTITVNCAANTNVFATSHTCQRICNALSAQGNHNGCSQATEGASCSISCNSGFTGSATTRQCGSDGAWSSSNPSCSLVSSWNLHTTYSNGLVIPDNYNSYGGFHHTGTTSKSAAYAYCKQRTEAHGGTEFSLWNVNRSNTWYCFGGNTPGNNAWGLYWNPWNGQESFYYTKGGRRLTEADEATGLVISGEPTEEQMQSPVAQEAIKIASL